MVAIKPTVGLVARDGVIPTSESQGTVGLVAQSVRNAAEILSLVARRSDFDIRTREIALSISNYAKLRSSTNLTGLRSGVPRNTLAKVPEEVLLIFGESH